MRITTKTRQPIFILYFCSLFGTFDAIADVSKPKSAEASLTFNVMAPLLLEGEQAWQNFEARLVKAKAMGVDGVSVDIWWGVVEASKDQQFDWSYYHRIAKLLRKNQLQWIPIMSFHQCGGNVGDDCNIPLPAWIWQHLGGEDHQSWQFKSEQGNTSVESVAFWHPAEKRNLLYAQYQEFMQAFETEFADYSDIIQELNVSMGAAGELRYPSYNAHDSGSGFPSRGALQGFGPTAKSDFQRFLSQKYADISALNSSWNTRFDSFKRVDYPADFSQIFAQGEHLKPGFGQDFLFWYHQSLLRHGAAVLHTAGEGFAGVFGHIPIGYKIPGIHWQMANRGGLTRSAELAAGLIPPSTSNADNLWGYQAILGLAKQFEDQTGRDVIVHFTALEMADNPVAPSYSKAKTLVSWLGQGANALGVTIKGENALAAGVHTNEGWTHIREAIQRAHYAGLTVLRISDVVALQEASVGQREYTKLIKDLRRH